MRKIFSLFLFIFLSFVSLSQAAEYKIDTSHSSVEFKVRHLISKVKGQFREFEGYLHYDENDLSQWKAYAKINASSIDTNVKKRDDHLRTSDFFHVEKYPNLEFKSSHATDFDGKKARLHGELTMHGITKPVILDLEIHGVSPDPWGGTRIGISATTTVSRKDFSVGWEGEKDHGALAIGQEVEITIEIEGILKS